MDNLWDDNDLKWVHRGVDKEGGGILTTSHNKNFNCQKIKGHILILGKLLNVGGKQPMYTTIINVYSNGVRSINYGRR